MMSVVLLVYIYIYIYNIRTVAVSLGSVWACLGCGCHGGVGSSIGHISVDSG